MATSTIALDAALDSILGEEGENTQTMTSNTDEKVEVYDVITGEPKPVLKIDARRVMRKRIPGSSTLAHWMPGMPGEPPVRVAGTVACFLHPDFDEKDGPAGFDRAFIDSIGLRGLHCNDGNPSNKNRGDFKTVFERDEHVRMRHTRTWRVVNDAKAEAARRSEAEERRLDREAQRAQTAAILAMAKTPAAKPAKE